MPTLGRLGRLSRIVAAHGIVVTVAASLVGGCSVASEAGPRTPTLTREPLPEVTLDGLAESVVVDGWACYSLMADQQAVPLIAGPAAYSEPGADFLVDESAFGALAVGQTWRVEGEYVAGDDADAARGRCPLADRYLAIAGGETVGD